jgi:putative phosphoribosyl transferase
MPAFDRLHVRERTVRARPVFADRTYAGRVLAEWIAPPKHPQALVLALPRGGIPVGRPLADAIGCVMHPVLVRKLPIPVNPEMGFGAITVDGTVTLNAEVVDAFRLDESTIEAIAAETLREVQRRSEAYPGGLPLPPLEGRDVWLVDDGLATGFSAIAAARMIRAHGAGRLRLAVPCAPRSSAELLAEHVDEVWCIIVQEGGSFAVASFYSRFPEMSDEEVVRLLD